MYKAIQDIRLKTKVEVIFNETGSDKEHVSINQSRKNFTGRT